MERLVCVHGHFYQPPRENPWLESIEQQDSAYPYHDWNERIAAECYAPNAAARILDDRQRVVDIVDNYARISFDFGPTLLRWLERSAPEVHRAVLEADRESARRFSGHGSAVAQSYNHTILPLSDARDRRTQVRWGVRDFEHRFRRPPEGMWLPETAVDLDTLEALAEEGILFTILSPSQAARVRREGGRDWTDVSGSRIDPTRAYRVVLPSGRRLALFFYDGPISRAVAFERLLDRGESLAGRLLGAFSEERGFDQLVHVATDGETYGHHHASGEMGLAWALQLVEAEAGVGLTNYGEFLERHPPTHEVEIVERTAWSCPHGLGRWSRDCGCRAGGREGWTQRWREPLRAALDWLRDTLAPGFEAEGGKLLRDPWSARDDYVEVVLDRSPERRTSFLERHALRPLDAVEAVRVWTLLEAQRNAQLMYTSCGWFFDDPSGIETVQVLLYAGAALERSRQILGDALEGPFLARLAEVRSNLPEQGSGADIYERRVRPAAVGLEKVAAHYALSSLFEAFPDRSRLHAFSAERQDLRTWEAGKARALLGRTRFTSEDTGESELLSFGALHLGDHNASAGVGPAGDDEPLAVVTAEFDGAFEAADLPRALRALDRHFGEARFSLGSLFPDEQRRVLGLLLEASLDEAAAVHERLYRDRAPLLRFLASLSVPAPRAFLATAELVHNATLRAVFRSEEPDLARARAAVEAARRERVTLDAAGLALAAERCLGRLTERFLAAPADLHRLTRLDEAVGLVRSLPFTVRLGRVQNDCWRLLRRLGPEGPGPRGPENEAWAARIRSLAEKLSLRI